MGKSSPKAKTDTAPAPEPATQAPEPTPIELAIETLSGDVRDTFLDKLRGMKKGWTELSQWEQQHLINDVTSSSKKLVRDVVRIIAERDLPAIQVTAGKWTVNDGAVKIELNAVATQETVGALIEHGKIATLVFVDAQAYFGERRPAVADLDQPDLPLKDGLSSDEALAAFEENKDKAPTAEEVFGDAPTGATPRSLMNDVADAAIAV